MDKQCIIWCNFVMECIIEYPERTRRCMFSYQYGELNEYINGDS